MLNIVYDIEPGETAALFAACHQRFWDRLAMPGTWLEAEERVAVAAEARVAETCSACARARQSLSPEAESGSHDRSDASLPEAWRGLIHRVIADPGRLSRSWFDRIRTAGVEDTTYVEILGTLVTVKLIDSFCRGLGLPLHPLPEPRAGSPSRHRPASAVLDDAWVPWIPADANTGAEADLWPRGRTGNVIRALSLVPDEVRTLLDTSDVHYVPIGDVSRTGVDGRALSRDQIELLAARVSALNQCFY